MVAYLSPDPRARVIGGAVMRSRTILEELESGRPQLRLLQQERRLAAQLVALERERRRQEALLRSPTTTDTNKPELTYSEQLTQYVQRWQREYDYYRPDLRLENEPPAAMRGPPAPTPSESIRATVQQKQESRAAAKLKLARTLAVGGNQADCREYLEEVVAKFSGTKAAGEAQRLLDSAAALRDFSQDR